MLFDRVFLPLRSMERQRISGLENGDMTANSVQLISRCRGWHVVEAGS